MYRNCTATRSLRTPTTSLYIITWLKVSTGGKGSGRLRPLHFFLFTYLQKGELGTVGEMGSLVAEYIEKRGWFPGQSGSQKRV